MNLRHAVYIALTFGAFVAAKVSFAQTIIVVRPDQGSLQDAINSIPDGGIIELTAGIYNASPGGFTIYGGTKGFTIRAAAGATVTLSGQGATDILRFTESSHVVTFQGLTFANGATQENFIGGAMTLVNVKAIFAACVFRSNSAGGPGGTGGGGLWINAAAISFNDCTWSNNTSPNFGAGFTALNSRVYLRNCSFTGNRTNLPNHQTNSAGAGIYGVNSVIQVNNCGFDNNQAGYVGGAIYLVGDWNSATPSVLAVADSEFTGNIASRDPSVAFLDPAVGGAIHTENQTTTTLIRCRFTDNIARQGGALSLFQSVAQITDCVFRGNRSTGIADGEGFGGTIMALSTDFANQPGPIVNHRPISLKITDTLFEGTIGVSGAREGGCIFAAGDLNSAFGLNGVPQNGSLDDNRGVVQLVRVGIFNYTAVAGGGLPGTGGAILGGFINLTIDNSIIANCTTTNSGAGLQLNDDSKATISRSIITNCSSGDPGAALTMFGGTLNVSETSFLQNHTSSSVRGAALTTAPAPTGSLPAFDVAGLIQDCVFSGNSGASTIYDGDRSAAPFNRLQYSGNQFLPDGPSLYIDDLGPFKNVELLNSYTIARPDGTTTIKAPVSNVALTSAPARGSILMVPPTVWQSGAPGEPLPISAYLVYASNGGSAVLDGTLQADSSGIVPTSVNGTHTLAVGSSSFSTVPPPGAALNISTRLPVGTGQNVLIGGFIVQGPIAKTVMIRAIGPSLPIPGALQDPVLELHDGAGAILATNDNWRATQIGGIFTSAQDVDIQASALAPLNDAESAIIATLSPGAYTAVVYGANDSTGIAVVEGYDLDADESSKLANISTRGFIQTGDNVMIGGFILGGGAGTVRVVVRGIGPSLGALGIQNALADPILELHDAYGALIDSNDDWRANQALIESTGLQPTNDAESALLLSNPPPGAYTAILRGKNGGTGIGVVEAYVFQ